MDTLRQQQFNSTCLSWRLGQGGMHKAALEKGTAWINTTTHCFRWTDMLFKEFVILWFWGLWASFLGSQCSDVCAEWGSQSLLLLRHVYLWGPQLKNSEDYFKKDHWHHCAKNLWHINSFSSLRSSVPLPLHTYHSPARQPASCKLKCFVRPHSPALLDTAHSDKQAYQQSNLSWLALLKVDTPQYIAYIASFTPKPLFDWNADRQWESGCPIMEANTGKSPKVTSQTKQNRRAGTATSFSKQHMTSNHPQKFLASFHGYAPCSRVMLTNGLKWLNNAEMVFKWLAVMLHYPCAQKIATIHPSCFHSADDSEGESSGCLN